MKHLLTVQKAIVLTMTSAALMAPSAGGSAVPPQDRTPLRGDTAASVSPDQPGPTNRHEVAAFLDGLVPREMETQHIAGAAVSIIKDGRLLFTKGYGYADLHNHISVDPETTNFRIGSVAKVFTWSAVMQLVEQGRSTWTRMSTPT